MIRSRDVIFNERVMYKDRHNTTTNDSELSKTVYVEMDDVFGSPTDESPQSEESVKTSIRQPSDTPVHPTSVPVLRRSSQPHAPNMRYIYYMLLTDGGEPEDYDEACRTTNASK